MRNGAIPLVISCCLLASAGDVLIVSMLLVRSRFAFDVGAVALAIGVFGVWLPVVGGLTVGLLAFSRRPLLVASLNVFLFLCAAVPMAAPLVVTMKKPPAAPPTRYTAGP